MKTVKALETKVIHDPEYSGSNLPVTRADFDALSVQRSLLLEFVAKQLRKGADYGTLPGIPKSSLFKPGAEKLSRLFGLGARFSLIDKTLDRQDNFALFNYKCEVYHLKSGQVIAECEGTANSQEKKFKERKAWVSGKQVTEATPVCDILNTLQKMAQKRAYVGAVILATGASDFFTQDIDDVDDAKTVGVVPEERPATSAAPKVTKVTNEAAPHNNSVAGSYWAEALTSYDDRGLARDAGFNWDKSAKKWLKQITAEEAAGFPFQTQRVS